MSRSIFGWSLPPGCGKLPGEEDEGCFICLNSVDNCICPPCPVCEDTGNPQCYVYPKYPQNHGMIKNAAQIESFNKILAQIEKENKEEAEFWENFDFREDDEIY